MIKNYKQFNESLRDLMVGPTEEEFKSHKLYIDSIKNGSLDGIKYAIEHGNLNKETIRNGLVDAVKNDYTDIVKYLIENGADYQSKNRLFDIALNHYNYDLVEFFINIGWGHKFPPKELVKYSYNTDTTNGIRIRDLMIKNNLYESLRDLMVGPTEEEVINSLKDNPLKLYSIGINTDNEKIQNIALKLITPEIKKNFVETLSDYMVTKGIEYVNYAYDIDEDETIYELPLKDWMNDGYKVLYDKIFQLNINKSFEDLLYIIYELDYELEDFI